MPLTLATYLLFQQQAAKPLKPFELVPGFSVSLSEKPEAVELGERGKYWRLTPKEDTAYVIGVFPVKAKTKPKPVDQELAAVAMGYARGTKGEITEQRDIVLQGWPGIELKIHSFEGLSGWMRAYIVNDVIYQVAAATNRADGQFFGVRQMFDSIKLPFGQGPLTEAGPKPAAFTFPGTDVLATMPGTPEVKVEALKGNRYGLTMHAAVVNYGNRSYLLAYSDIPEKVTKEALPDHLINLLEAWGDELVPGLKGKNIKERQYTVKGVTVLSSEFTSSPGIPAYGRIDTLYLKGRCYLLLAMVPQALKSSSEVVKFFGSLEIKAESN